MSSISRTPAMWLGWAFAAGLLAVAAYVVLTPQPPLPDGPLPDQPLPAASAGDAKAEKNRSAQASLPASAGENDSSAARSSGAATTDAATTDTARSNAREHGSRNVESNPDANEPAPPWGVDDEPRPARGEPRPPEPGSRRAASNEPATETRDSQDPRPAAGESASVDHEPRIEGRKALASLHPMAQFDNVVVRDHGDRVVQHGTVDLLPTLERIDAGRRLQYPDDGIVFQNRERRLLAKPRGYYHEYVLPTEGLAGPGPQRVVVGSNGEVYYSADHYHSFRRLP